MDSARAACTLRRSSKPTARYAAERTSGWRKRTQVPRVIRPDASASVAARSTSMPRRSAALRSRDTSPTGSVAAMSSNCCACAERVRMRRRKPASIWLDRGRLSGTPNPPAISRRVRPRGSSTRASGLPRVSATIRSRTRWSSGPVTTESRSRRESRSPSPRTASSGRSASTSREPDSRTARTIRTGSASSRRATNSSVWAETRSSHCASSTRHSNGSSPAAASRLNVARPTRNRSGASPTCIPKAVRRALRCGSGILSRWESRGAQSWCSPA
ncbi:hypothetical protein RKD33_001105 [Streptomyces sp. SAI-129]